MILRTVFALLMVSSLALAEPAAPATRPSQRNARSAPATRPATQPAAKSAPAAEAVANMVQKIKDEKKAKAQQLQVAYIDLDRPVGERPPQLALFADTSLTLQSIIERLHKARDDKSIRAVLLNIGETEFNLAQAQEIRDALVSMRKVGKRTFIFSDNYETPSYIAASGASDICILPGGEIVIPGVGLETMFAKGLLDKVGVKADYIQIGQYKGADEEYTRTEPSPELRGELNKITDALYEQIVDGIANNRNISRNAVKDMIDGVFLSAKVAHDRKLVDHLVDQDGLRELLEKELGREINLVHDYGRASHEPPDLSNPFALLSMLMKKPADEAPKKGPAIAVIYAEGVIVDGDGADGLLSSGTIGSEDLRKALRIARRDENVEAIVLRIDSPGGSAPASEVMWQAAKRAADEKPLIVSVGGMAASGGYYLASAGDKIVADPSAIVGSIGVVGGKFVLQGLFDWAGLKTETFSRGANADLFSSNHPFTEAQRRLVTNWMQGTYDQFVQRVMSTRGKKIADIDDVARGRIFLAKQAKQLGMVDELGGIDKAIAIAAEDAGLEAGKYDIRIIPATKTLGDLLRGNDPDAAMPFRPKVELSNTGLLQTFSPTLSRLVKQQLQMLTLLQRRPVMLVCPYAITLK